MPGELIDEDGSVAGRGVSASEEKGLELVDQIIH